MAASSLNIIYASTSGHTQYVVDTLISFLKNQNPSLLIEKKIAEQTTVEDLAKGDVLILASSTWNTGSVEGQLNPHMYMLLLDRAKALDLAGKKVALIGLGDKRYFFTCKAADHLEHFVQSHGGTQVGSTLRIVNEPYGQEKTVEEWGKELLSSINA